MLPWRRCLLLPLLGCLGELLLQGPVFIREPNDSTVPVGPRDRSITLPCEAKGNPAPQYRWWLNGSELDLSLQRRYQLHGGNLVLLSPSRSRDTGSYQCVASNAVGTVVSREAKLQFAYLENFQTKMRSTVSVWAGQGVVLLCGPPPHAGELSYAWIFNEAPAFVEEDHRRFVSQETGHLYVAKVEPSDVGNYTCVVTSSATGTRVRGSATPLVLRADGSMGEYEPKIEVQPPETLPAAKGSTVRLECFALGNPVPQIRWRRGDGLPFPGKVRVRKAGAVLEVPSFQQEDTGFYECVAENTRGSNLARGRLTYYAKPHWVQPIRDVEAAVQGQLRWECRASGKPKPSYRWLKDGAALRLEERTQVDNGALTIWNLTVADSGMFQCVAENKHGLVYSSAELRVLASAPDFSRTPMHPRLQVQVGRNVTLDCRPRASPQARCSWARDGRRLQEGGRVSFLRDGGLQITNVSKAEAGSYTCTARNQFGQAQGSTYLEVSEPTRMVPTPDSMDVSVGESVVLPCQVRHDPQLTPSFRWSFNGAPVDFGTEGVHIEQVGGAHGSQLWVQRLCLSSQGLSGDLMIRNVQLKHSGKYVCEVQTAVDSVSSASDLVVRGSPGPPMSLKVTEVTDTSAQLSWMQGTDGGSPVLAYSVQARTPFSVGWQPAATVPKVLDGKTHIATVIHLTPWVEYEFRVVARNGVGAGEPSSPSEKVRTEEAAPEVPPAEVSGGGGSRSELVISWDPVPEELQNGAGFGYVVAFRPLGVSSWIQTVVTSPEAPRYVFRNESITPFSPYEVKVGVYNNKGEGPFSPPVTVFSAEEEPAVAPGWVSAHSLSSSELEVSWDTVAWKPSNGNLLGYEVRCWSEGEESSPHLVRVDGNRTWTRLGGLRSNLAYHTAVRAFNSAGPGPFSAAASTTTRKTPPSQPPGRVAWNATDSTVLLSWDQVRALENESEVTGYKVLYRTSGRREVQVLSTDKTWAELHLPGQHDYILEVRAITDGGDGASSGNIRIPRRSRADARGASPALLRAQATSSSCVPTVLLFLLNALW